VGGAIADAFVANASVRPVSPLVNQIAAATIKNASAITSPKITKRPARSSFHCWDSLTRRLYHCHHVSKLCDSHTANGW
jgi:hypothetical protein